MKRRIIAIILSALPIWYGVLVDSKCEVKGIFPYPFTTVNQCVANADALYSKGLTFSSCYNPVKREGVDLTCIPTPVASN